MPDRRAIQNKGRQNLFRPLLQSERTALRIIAAAGRTLLGDVKAVLSRNRSIGSHDGFKPEEIIFRLSTNHTFYSDGWYGHLIGSGYIKSEDYSEGSPGQSLDSIISAGALVVLAAPAPFR
jgi:hypothetical protein